MLAFIGQRNSKYFYFLLLLLLNSYQPRTGFLTFVTVNMQVRALNVGSSCSLKLHQLYIVVWCHFHFKPMALQSINERYDVSAVWSFYFLAPLKRYPWEAVSHSKIRLETVSSTEALKLVFGIDTFASDELLGIFSPLFLSFLLCISVHSAFSCSISTHLSLSFCLFMNSSLSSSVCVCVHPFVHVGPLSCLGGSAKSRERVLDRRSAPWQNRNRHQLRELTQQASFHSLPPFQSVSLFHFVSIC